MILHSTTLTSAMRTSFARHDHHKRFTLDLHNEDHGGCDRANARALARMIDKQATRALEQTFGVSKRETVCTTCHLVTRRNQACAYCE